jgi:molybdenum cofactor synthesis domain-containing protein
MYRAGIVTLSDKGAAGEREDRSGAVLKEMLEAAGIEVVSYRLLADEGEELKKELVRLSDEVKCDLVLTTGGTGFSPRDVTPEATFAVADRNAPGIAEAIRAYSMTVTKRAMLSRGASVIRGSSLIINLPGSPKAVRESLEYILDTLFHGLEILSGRGGECAGASEAGQK